MNVCLQQVPSNTFSFFDEKEILIVESRRNYQSILKQAFIELGINRDKIFTTDSIEKAHKFLDSKSPQIIISEFDINDRFGLELSHRQKEYCTDITTKLFTITSCDPTECAVADAAEEDVDIYLLKPFDKKTVKEYVQRTVIRKLYPTKQQLLIGEIKSYLEFGQVVFAEQKLRLLENQYPGTLTGFYLKGQIDFHKRDYVQAISAFEQGLTINPIHYKCLLGLLDSYQQLGDRKNAYKTIKKIGKNFPLTSSLLKKGLILNILTYNFAETGVYYQRYLRQPRKDAKLKQVMAQGLLAAGKISLREGKRSLAKDYFKKGAVISGRDTDYIANILTCLIKHGELEACHEYFGMLDMHENPSLVHHLQYRHLVASDHTNESLLIKEGQKLIMKNSNEEFVFQAVIDAAQRSGKRFVVDKTAHMAAKKFNKLKRDFLPKPALSLAMD